MKLKINKNKRKDNLVGGFDSRHIFSDEGICIKCGFTFEHLQVMATQCSGLGEKNEIKDDVVLLEWAGVEEITNKINI